MMFQVKGAKSIPNRVLSTRQLTRAKCSLATRIWSGTHSFDPTFDADAPQTPLSSDHDEEHSIIVWMKCGHQSENQFETELQQEQHDNNSSKVTIRLQCELVLQNRGPSDVRNLEVEWACSPQVKFDSLHTNVDTIQCIK